MQPGNPSIRRHLGGPETDPRHRVLISVECSLVGLRSVIGDDDDVVIAALTAAELHPGIELADERNRTRRAQFVAHLIDVIPVEPYDLSITQAHGRLLAGVKGSGTRQGTHDLIIAATAP